MFRHFNNLRMPHRVDVLTMERNTQPSGQREASWHTQEHVKCYYVPHRATIRVSPTSEETEKIMLFFNSNVPIDFKTRFANLTDRDGNVFPHLEGKTFEVISMNHFSNYSGKPHHIQVVVETVIE
jgi:hypothetical protein